MKPFAFLVFDGERLSADPHAPGRRMRVDARCLAGAPVEGAYAHVCALPDRDAALRFDEPEVQQVRRDALAWWIPLLGEAFVCVTTLAVDSVRFAGSITVATTPEFFADDPFARIFAATVVRTDLFCEVPSPPGPVIERYAGTAWPGGRFTNIGDP